MDWVTERQLENRKTPVTRVWVSERALKRMNKDAPATFGAQLDRWQEHGFGNYVTVSVRSEGKGVWRIGPGGANFRLLGFPEFGNVERDDFIVILGGMKPKNRHLQEWIGEVASVRERKDWQRVELPKKP